jgi:hypothetical protein
MSSYVSAALRREVQTRADGICEYCLIHESDTYLGCQVDHMVSEKARRRNGDGQFGVRLHLLQSGQRQRRGLDRSQRRVHAASTGKETSGPETWNERSTSFLACVLLGNSRP